MKLKLKLRHKRSRSFLAPQRPNQFHAYNEQLHQPTYSKLNNQC